MALKMESMKLILTLRIQKSVIQKLFYGQFWTWLPYILIIYFELNHIHYKCYLLGKNSWEKMLIHNQTKMDYLEYK